MKRKMDGSVRGKTETSMKNEVLAKLVCYNLKCCIAERYTLRIKPVFLGISRRKMQYREAWSPSEALTGTFHFVQQYTTL